MNWLLLTICCILSVEIIVRINFVGQISLLRNVVFKAIQTVRSPLISDYWKETILPKYAAQILRNSIALLLILFFVISPFALAAALAVFVNIEFSKFLASLEGLVSTTVIALLYFWMRKPSPNKAENYTFSSKLLHYAALSNPAVSDASFQVERSLYLKKATNVERERHVFIAGLARSGSTILTRALYETNHFSSLTYRDMPFVLAPNLWRNIWSRSVRHKQAEERAHGDGLLVDFDSPEALEEVFWRVQCGKNYIRKNALIPMNADDECISNFKDYVSLILLSKSGTRYLSKNNNNMLRFSSIQRAFPNAIILVPYRNPIQHAYSLLQQHLRFTQKEHLSRFTAVYMSWLAHHEFGVDHRRFKMDETEERSHTPDQLDYWLSEWIDVYGYIRGQKQTNLHYVSYDNMCRSQTTEWEKICNLVGLPQAVAPIRWNKSNKVVSKDASLSLIKQAESVYGALQERAI